MKSIFSLTVSVPLIQAQGSERLQKLAQDVQALQSGLAPEQFEGNQQFPPPAGERALLKNDVGLLDRYGCWCLFEGDHGSGRGKPIDEIDTMCKTLHDGYTCIMSDAANRNENCVPWEIPYNSAFGSGIPTGLTMAGLIEECDRQNTPDSCEAWTCKVEGWFVQSWFDYSVNGGEINLDFRHENGFNPRQDCPISSGIQSEKACCSYYPVRFPFKTYNGNRDCCYTKTFNTEMFSCCDDGRVRIQC